MTDRNITTPPVWCLRCQKPVDEFWVVQNPLELAFTYVALCHGERDECVQPLDFLRDASVPLVRIEAFSDKRLPEAHD